MWRRVGLVSTDVSGGRYRLHLQGPKISRTRNHREWGGWQLARLILRHWICRQHPPKRRFTFMCCIPEDINLQKVKLFVLLIKHFAAFLTAEVLVHEWEGFGSRSDHFTLSPGTEHVTGWIPALAWTQRFFRPFCECLTPTRNYSYTDWGLLTKEDKLLRLSPFPCPFLPRNILPSTLFKRSRESWVGTANGYEREDRGVGVRVSVRSRIFSSPRPPNLLSSGYRGESCSGRAWSWPPTSS
jgi:hypothetical protein